MRRKLLFLMAFAAFATAAYLLLQRDFDRRLFLESFENLSLPWIGASIVALFLGYLLRAVRWRLLLLPLKPIPLGPLLGGTILGFAAIFTLGRPGEFVRPVWIARRADISTVGSFAAITVERVFDLIMMMLLAAVTLTVANLPPAAAGPIGRLQPVMWLLLAAATAILIMATALSRKADDLPSLGRFNHLLQPFIAGLAAAAGFRSLLALGGASLLVWLSIALQFWLMLAGMNFEINGGGAILILTITAVGSLIQIPGIGGGFQAAFAFGLTAIFLVPAETAIAASLLAWVIQYAPTLAAAAGYMMWKGISAREIAGKPA